MSAPVRRRSRVALSQGNLAERLDQITLELIGIKAAVVTAQAVLSNRAGVDGEVATNLMRGAIIPLDLVLKLIRDWEEYLHQGDKRS